MNIRITIAAACFFAAALVPAGAAQTRPPVRKATVIEKHFEGRGRVLLFQGQPCSPQIMFDLRQSFPKSTIRLAASLRESRVLTDLARHRRSARVAGIWRHGRAQLCRFVEVTSVIAD